MIPNSISADDNKQCSWTLYEIRWPDFDGILNILKP
jgi:hypothetical protein